MKLQLMKEIVKKNSMGPTKWELDNIVWAERFTDTKILLKFFNRINDLIEKKESLSHTDKIELSYLLEILDDMEETDVQELLDRTEEQQRDSFIEELARTSAIEILTTTRMSVETMTIACKLNPNDFILCAKRTQDLINSIQGLVLKGEILSQDIAQA